MEQKNRGINKEKIKIMKGKAKIKRKKDKDKEVPLEIKYVNVYLRQLKTFTTKEQGIYPVQQLKVAQGIKLLSDISENYLWNIDNVMNDDIKVKKMKNLILKNTYQKKLELISLITQL